MGAPINNPGVEPESVDTTMLFSVIGVSVVIIFAIVVVGFEFAKMHFQDYKLEVTTVSGYPTLHETEMNGHAKLSGYEANDDGTYKIPIERAMELEAQSAGQ